MKFREKSQKGLVWLGQVRFEKEGQYFVKREKS